MQPTCDQILFITHEYAHILNLIVGETLSHVYFSLASSSPLLPPLLPPPPNSASSRARQGWLLRGGGGQCYSGLFARVRGRDELGGPQAARQLARPAYQDQLQGSGRVGDAPQWPGHHGSDGLECTGGIRLHR